MEERQNFNIQIGEIHHLLSGMGGWAVLDLTSILFIKSKLQCGRFAPFCNFEVSFHKISVRSNTVFYDLGP